MKYLYILPIILVYICLTSTALYSQQQYGCDTGTDTEPDFTECNDILEGERTFFPVDDLAFTIVGPPISFTNPSQNVETNVNILETENSAISSQLAPISKLLSMSTDAPYNNIVFGRFTKSDVFSSPFDTNPNSETGILIAPNSNNDSFAQCDGVVNGNDILVMNFFKEQGVFDCAPLPTTLPFSGPNISGNNLNGNVWSTVVADFNKDGLDELFVNYLPAGGYTILTFEDVDSEDFTSKMKMVPLGTEPSGLNLRQATTGDLNGDGFLEIIGVQERKVAELFIDDLELVILELNYDSEGNPTSFKDPIIINSKFLNIDFQLFPGTPVVNQNIAVAVGNFDNTSIFQDEIVLAAVTRDTGLLIGSVVALEIDLGSGSSCTAGTNCTSGDGSCPCVQNLTEPQNITTPFGVISAQIPLRLKSKRLLNGAEMAVLSVNATGSGLYQVSALDFNGQTNNPLDFELISFGDNDNDDTPVCLHDIALGNFDSDSDSAELQIAALLTETNDGNCFNVTTGNVKILSLNQNTKSLDVLSTTIINSLVPAPSADPVQLFNYINLEAGDIQGRSTLLSNPNKVTIYGSMQPKIVLGAPPMHVDYIQPPEGGSPSGEPTETNFTAIPGKFFSQYNLQQSSENQSSSASDTSYTFSTEESADAKIGYGIPFIDESFVKIEANAEQVSTNNVSKKYSNFSSTEFSVSTATAFSDLIWFDQKIFNVWFYKVLSPDGMPEMVCPVENKDCSESEKHPLVLQFSAPVVCSSCSQRLPGNQVEWFQPPYQTGNIWSYPWDMTQLESTIPTPPGFSTLGNSEVWSTGDTSSQVGAEWSSGSGSDLETGSVSEHSYNTSISAQVSFDFEGLDGDVGDEFQTGESDSISNMNTTELTIGSSIGIDVEKTAFTAPSYEAQSYIFAQNELTKSEGYFDNVTLDVDNPTSGPVWLGFWANPLSNPSTSPYWEQAYILPDIALNHPLQWSCTQSGNCTFDEADTSDPSTSNFYKIKGLFITSGDTGTGPQTTCVKAGDTITLSARVYNLSPAALKSDEQVKVQFYASEWDISSASITGDSILIDTVVIDEITEFGGNETSGNNPNWEIATTTYDTSGKDDTYYIFWLVTWAEKTSSGDLVDEIAGHGLDAAPKSGGEKKITDIQAKDHSNNVGFYNQPFYIGPETTTVNSCIDDPEETLLITNAKDGEGLNISSIDLSQFSVDPGQKILITTNLSNDDTTPKRDIMLTYYDGNPDEGGEAFDVEMVPVIRSGDMYVNKVSFTAEKCGFREIFVQALHRLDEPVLNSANLLVDCPAPPPDPVPVEPENDENIAIIGEITIESPMGTTISNAQQAGVECPNEIEGITYSFPFGFISYKVSNLIPGETIQIEIDLPEGDLPVTFFKFGPTPDNPVPHCYEFEFNGERGAQVTPSGDIILSITDGGLGDSDLTADGMIIDPGGPAFVAAAVITPPDSGDGDSNNSGCSLTNSDQSKNGIINFLIPFAALIVIYSRFKREHK